MKKLLLLTLLLFLIVNLVACSTHIDETPSTTQEEIIHKPVEKVGEVPAEFKSIIENDLLNEKKAFKNYYLGYTRNKSSLEVAMYDLYGNIVAKKVKTVPSGYQLCSMMTTSDGGFVYSIGISYNSTQYKKSMESGDGNVWAKIIKCSKEGNIQWEITLEDYTYENLRFCYQNSSYFYFFGTKKRNETEGETLGVYSDIIALKISNDGKTIQSETYGSRNNHSLLYVYYNEQSNSFTLNIVSSSGGTFPIDERWTFDVDRNLEISNKTTRDQYDGSDRHIGILNGKYITMSCIENYKDYPGGNIYSIMDHGDFYLVVSSNITKEYENTPAWVNTFWFCTETVYSAYKKDGTLLWRDSVDSTPDYEARIKESEKYYGE